MAPTERPEAREAVEYAPPWSAKHKVEGAAPELVVDLGHQRIGRVAFSPRGRIAAVTERHEGLVVLRDTQTGREIRRFAVGRHDTARCASSSRRRILEQLQFVGGPERLLTSVRDPQGPRTELWDTLRGQPLWGIDGVAQSVSRSGEVGVVTLPRRREMRAKLVDLQTGRSIAELFDSDVEDKRDWRFRVSPDGERVVGTPNVSPTVPADFVRLWDGRTGERIGDVPTIGASPVLFLSHDSRWFAAAGRKGDVQLFASESGVLESTVARPDGWSLTGFAPDDSALLMSHGVFSGDKQTRAVDPQSGATVREYPLVVERVEATGLYGWVKREGWTNATGFARVSSATSDVLQLEPGEFWVSPSGSTSIGMRDDGPNINEYAFMLDEGGQTIKLDGEAREVEHVRATSGDRVLVELAPELGIRGGGRGHTAMVFDLASATMANHFDDVRWGGVVLSPDGSWAMVESLRRADQDVNTILELWRIGDASPVRRLSGGDGMMLGPNARWALIDAGYWTSLADEPRLVSRSNLPDRAIGRIPGVISGDGTLAAVGTTQLFNGGARAGGVAVWSTADGAPLWEINPEQGEWGAVSPLGEVIDLALNREGTRLAIAEGSWCRASVYDSATGDQMLELPHGDTVHSVAFDGSGRILTATGGFSGGNSVQLFSAEGTPLARFDHEAKVTEADFLSNDYAISSSVDRTVRIWDLRNGQEAIRLVFLEDGRWFAVDREGRFDTNAVDRLGDIHFTAPGQPLTLVPIEAFSRDYFHPGVVGMHLRRDELPSVPDVSRLNVAEPKIEITDVRPSGDGLVDVTVRVRDVVARKGNGEVAWSTEARDLRLFRDGRLVRRNSRRLTDESGDGTHRFEGIALPTGAESVGLSAYAFNRDGVKSRTTSRTHAIADPKRKRKGVAYVINVGVDRYRNSRLDLAFAAADARRMQTELVRGLKESRDFSKVVPLILISDDESVEATENALVAALEQLSGARASAGKLRRSTPDDVVIFTFAGHGVAAASGEFSLLMSDYGGELSTVRGDAAGVLTDVELADVVEQLDAAELVFVIDACQSSSAIAAHGFKPGPLGSRGLGQMAYDKGMRVLAATEANDVALELDAIGHGLLTYALAVEGLAQGKADLRPADGRIVLDEWLDYGTRRVPALTDAILAGDLASRGLRRVAAPEGVSVPPIQEPRLFDFSLSGSTTQVGARP